MTDVQVLVVGPEGTPYQNGLFEFDVWLPSTYPSIPPKVHTPSRADFDCYIQLVSPGIAQDNRPRVGAVQSQSV